MLAEPPEFSGGAKRGPIFREGPKTQTSTLFKPYELLRIGLDMRNWA
jgi:hypothetical protein